MPVDIDEWHELQHIAVLKVGLDHEVHTLHQQLVATRQELLDLGTTLSGTKGE